MSGMCIRERERRDGERDKTRWRERKKVVLDGRGEEGDLLLKNEMAVNEGGPTQSLRRY